MKGTKYTLPKDREHEFPECINKTIPKSIDECIAPDPVAETILNLQGKIGLIGMIVLALIIIFGIFIALFTSLIVLLWVAGIALAEYIAFKQITLLLGALASFVQNKAISTNLEIFKTYREISDSDNNTSTEEI